MTTVYQDEIARLRRENKSLNRDNDRLSNQLGSVAGELDAVTNYLHTTNAKLDELNRKQEKPQTGNAPQTFKLFEVKRPTTNVSGTATPQRGEPAGTWKISPQFDKKKLV